MIDKRLLMTLLCLLAGHFVGGPTAVAQPPRQFEIDHEYEFKAHYLYYFALLCTWPGEETGPIVIGVFGPNRFGRQLQRLEKQSENLTKRIVTRVFDDIDEFEACQILYVSGRRGEAQTEERLRQALEKTKNQATLIFTENLEFTEQDAFAKQGTAVNFCVDKNLLKLLINLPAARKAGVTIHERLLNLKNAEMIPPREADR